MPVFGSHLSFRRCCRKQMLVVRYDETILAIIFRTFPWSIACSIPNIGELWLWRLLLRNKKVPSLRWFLTKKLGSPLWSSWAGTLFLPRQNPVQGHLEMRNHIHWMEMANLAYILVGRISVFLFHLCSFGESFDFFDIIHSVGGRCRFTFVYFFLPLAAKYLQRS